MYVAVGAGSVAGYQNIIAASSTHYIPTSPKHLPPPLSLPREASLEQEGLEGLLLRLALRLLRLKLTLGLIRQACRQLSILRCQLLSGLEGVGEGGGVVRRGQRGTGDQKGNDGEGPQEDGGGGGEMESKVKSCRVVCHQRGVGAFCDYRACSMCCVPQPPPTHYPLHTTHTTHQALAQGALLQLRLPVQLQACHDVLLQLSLALLLSLPRLCSREW